MTDSSASSVAAGPVSGEIHVFNSRARSGKGLTQVELVAGSPGKQSGWD